VNVAAAVITSAQRASPRLDEGEDYFNPPLLLRRSLRRGSSDTSLPTYGATSPDRYGALLTPDPNMGPHPRPITPPLRTPTPEPEPDTPTDLLRPRRMPWRAGSTACVTVCLVTTMAMPLGVVVGMYIALNHLR